MLENFNQAIKHLKKFKKTISLWLIIFVVLGLIITFIQPLEYRSTAGLLIINKINPTLDAYTAARAAEKLADNLTTIIYTTSFMDTVVTAYPENNINLPTDDRARRKAWAKKVEATIKQNTSILLISTYDKNKEEAEKLTYLVASTLVTRGQEYHGGGEDVIIKFVDKPLTSNYPVRPNMLINLFSSVLIGFLVGYLVSLKKL